MRRVDVAVVGAGPAGIAAALASAQSGADTLLIDENPEIGGQLRWRITSSMEEGIGLGFHPAPGPEIAHALTSRIDSVDNLDVATGTVAWGLFEDNVLGISNESTAGEVQASRIVLATGSTDIAMPFPGWTLPGVLTARAVQIFMHVHRVLPGRKWAILGDTPEAEELAGDLERSGAEVVTRLSEVENLRASGTNRLAHVEYGEEVYEVDGLVIALGRQPDPELAIQAQAGGAFDWGLGGYTVQRDADGLTSVPGVYVAGDAAGIGNLAELIAEGWLSGLAAASADADALTSAREELDRVSSDQRRSATKRMRLQASST